MSLVFAVIWKLSEKWAEFIWRSLVLSMWTDVDVIEPDEKSIVTYVSLLYDTFPNVPSLEQSLRDNVSFTSLFHQLLSLLKFS